MNKLRSLLRKDTSLSILVVFMIVLLIVFAVTLGDKMFGSRNLTSMAFQVSEFAVISLGMSLVMLLGGIDLSIIANANLSAIISGLVLTGKFFDISTINTYVLILLTIVITLIMSTILGFINGVLIAKMSVPPLIATLGTMILYNGIGMAITSGKGVVGFPEEFLQMGSGIFLGIPYIFIVFIFLAIIYMILMGKTPFGKKVTFIGENHTTARFSGINNEKNIMIAYAISGLMAGIASLMIMTRVNSAKVGYGDTYLLQAMLVVVLGGVSPSGGKGKISGVLLAIFSLQMLQSAFTLLQFTPYAKKLIWGAMLITVMSLNYMTDYYKTKSQKKMLSLQIKKQTNQST